MKYDLKILSKYVNDGLIVYQTHPTLPLRIYNYTRTCQFERKWDEITLACRGLVLDNDGNVIAKPFPKFFNLEEIEDKGIIPTNETFEVFDKMDGSLGIMFKYNDEMIIATRGSFTSPQAIKAYEIAERLSYDQLIVEGYTYLFEIIYPENRIVVDYGNEERLVLLGMVDMHTGKEIPHSDIIKFDEGWDLVMRYDGLTDFTKLKELKLNNSEGFVVRFANGFRMKVKFDEYCRLHKILTNTSTLSVWEMLMENKPLAEILENTPDEFDGWVENVMLDLKIKFRQKSLELLIEYGKFMEDFRYMYYNLEILPTRKDCGMYFLESKNKHYMYKLLDGKSIRRQIWKELRPNFEKAFV